MAIRDHASQGYGAKARAKIMTVDTANRRVEAGLKDGSMAQIAIWDDAGHTFRWPKEGEIWIIRRDSGVWRLDSRVQSGQIDQGGLSAEPEPAPIATRAPGDMRLDSSAIFDADGKRLATTDGLAYQTVAVNDTAEPPRAALDLKAGSGVTLTAIDDVAHNRTQVTLAASASTSYGRVTTDIAGTGSMVNVPGMGFAVGANEVWSFSVYVFIVASAPGGASFNFQFTGPSSPSSFRAAGQVAVAPVVVSAFSSVMSVPENTGTTETLMRINGTLVNGPNAGIVQLQQQSVTITQTVKASSYLLATEGS